MALNESKGNMYPGVKTWNPLAGKCPHGCTYCSTNSLMRYPVIKDKYSGGLRINYKTLSKNLGSGNTWFACAQNDLFSKEVSSEFIYKILGHCCRFDNHYLFQTKNPEGFIPFINGGNLFPAKTILCTTIETNRIYPQMGQTPRPDQRAYAMNCISEFPKQVTIEPIMDFDLSEMIILIKQANPASVNIGADSKGNHLPEPSKEKLLALIDELKKFTVIDQKRNLARLLK
jgi:hypothetical protein